MKRYTIAFALVFSLLAIAAVSFNGCGKSNTITSITVLPSDPFIAMGKTRQLIVTAHFSGGMSLTFWTQVTWQSSDPTVATVSSNGLVFGVKEGTAVITAVDIAHPSITNSVTATVTSLTSITIAPLDATISAGTSTQQFTATGTYSAATPSTAPADLTSSVTWSTSNAAVASISNSTGSNGLATAGTTTGTTTITATDLATRMTGTATLTVVP